MQAKAALRVLIVRLGAMGDIIHALPASALLRKALPGADLSWAIEEQWTPLLASNPDIDHVMGLPIRRWRKQMARPATWREIGSWKRRLRQGGFDAAIDFQGLLKSAFVAHLSRADAVFGFARGELREAAAGAFYSQRVDSASTHVVEKNLDLAWAVAIGLQTGTGALARRSDLAVTFHLPEGVAEGALPKDGFVLTSPVAGWHGKQWPAEFFGELAGILHRETGMPLLVDCAPADRAEGERIVALARPGTCRLHISSIEGLIAATRRARAVVGVDSGPLHLAAALGIPGVAIYGQTDPARNGPFGTSFRVLRSPGVTTSYRRRGEIDESMRRMEPGAVWRALQPILYRIRDRSNA